LISLDNILDGVKTVGICGHVKPDGDAFGSCMGLFLFLKTYYPAIRATVYLEDNYPKSYEFVSCSDQVVHDYPAQEAHDLFIALDSGDLQRLGEAQGYFHAAGKTVVIDHHISNVGYGMIREIQPEASSTSELVALMIGKDRITKEIAEPLYMGIAHDTGIFQYSCTSSRTMMVGGWLMDTGIDFSWICDETFFLKSYRENQVLGRALAESILIMDGKLIFSALRRKDLDFYQVDPKNLDGIVQQLRVTRGVETAVFLYEVAPNRYKVSLRSNGVIDCSVIAAYFGGGGHVRAAGCVLEGTFHDAVNNLSKQIEKQYKEND
jgi:phosphoesterase RecJ-like protein